MADAERLHIAVVIPPFRRGSGGHSTIYNLLTRLEERGHTVSTWLHDPLGCHARRVAGGDPRQPARVLPPDRAARCSRASTHWYGADVVLATGWDTVYPVLRLDHCRARAYLVQDHEPEFFATSAESLFARADLPAGLLLHRREPVAARPRRATRYGAHASSLRPRRRPRRLPPAPRRRAATTRSSSTPATSRRGGRVPLGVLALQELHRRRPDTRFVLFGDDGRVETPFPYEHLGVASPEQLSWAYSEATVGLSLSLTNYSLIPQEMLACGLPCVELAGAASRACSAPTGRSSSRRPTRSRSPTRSSGCSTTRRCGSAAPRPGCEFVADTTWDHAAVAARGRPARRAARARSPRPAPRGRAARRGRRARRARTRRAGRRSRVTATERCSRASTPRTSRPSRTRSTTTSAALWDGVDADNRAQLTLVSRRLARDPGRAREDRPAAGRAARRRARDGARAARRRRRLLLRATCSPRRCGASAPTGRGASAGSTSAAPRAASSARSRPRSREAEWHGVRPERRGDRVGARAPARRSSSAVARRTRRCPTTTARSTSSCAISIWSHYGERAAMRWLDEMHRDHPRPAAASCSPRTACSRSPTTPARASARPCSSSASAARCTGTGFWFADEFGEAGRLGRAPPRVGHGVLHARVARASTRCPQWAIEDFAVGQNADNQDMYVLRRR